MGHFSFGDDQPTGLQALVRLGDGAMLPEAPEAYEGNDIQIKFPMWQGPPSFFFGVRAHMIASTGRSVALTNGDPELEDPLSKVTTFRRVLYAIHKGFPHCEQVRCSGLKLARNCASGLGVRRAIVFLLVRNTGQPYPCSVHLLSRRVFRSAKKLNGTFELREEKKTEKDRPIA